MHLDNFQLLPIVKSVHVCFNSAFNATLRTANRPIYLNVTCGEATVKFTCDARSCE